jgi:hypothetical protein
VGFTASRRVHLSAFGDSAIWAVAMIGASAPLRLGALSRSRSKLLVIFRDPEHYLLGCFVIHLLGQDTGFLGSFAPMFWIVEMRDIGHGSRPLLGPDTLTQETATMYLMQALIFCAIVGSNIHWQWTPNQYLASGIGAGSAWIATHIIVAWRDRRGHYKK